MKTLLLSVGGLALLALAALLAYAATRPDMFRFERSVTIAASPEQIHPLINDMRRFNTWNPYNRKDPAMKGSYRGPEAGPGAAFDFDGNHNIGKGTISIVEPSGPNTVNMQLDMREPMNARNQIEFRLRPQGGSTEVTWSLQGPTPYIAKVMHIVLDVEGMMRRDLDTGLAALKALAERRG